MKYHTLIFFAVLILFFSGCMVAGEDYIFGRDMATVTKRIETMLLDKKSCVVSYGRCAEGVIFSKPLSGGYRITSYGVTDTALLEDIRGILHESFNSNPAIKQVHFRAFRFKREHYGAMLFASGDSFLAVDFER